jgi:hypothetical protein
MAEGRVRPGNAVVRRKPALSGEMSDTHWLATSLLSLAFVSHSRGDSETPTELYEESMHRFREQGDKQGLAYCLKALRSGWPGTGPPVGVNAVPTSFGSERFYELRHYGVLRSSGYSTPPVPSWDGPPKLGSGHGAQPSQRRCPSALVSLRRAPDNPSRSDPLGSPPPRPRSPDPPAPS